MFVMETRKLHCTIKWKIKKFKSLGGKLFMAKFNCKTGNIGFCRKWKLSFEWSRKLIKAFQKFIEISTIFHTLQKNSIKFECLKNKRQFKKNQ
jgi:hypothetical protein